MRLGKCPWRYILLQAKHLLLLSFQSLLESLVKTCCYAENSAAPNAAAQGVGESSADESLSGSLGVLQTPASEEGSQRPNAAVNRSQGSDEIQKMSLQCAKIYPFPGKSSVTDHNQIRILEMLDILHLQNAFELEYAMTQQFIDPLSSSCAWRPNSLRAHHMGFRPIFLQTALSQQVFCLSSHSTPIQCSSLTCLTGTSTGKMLDLSRHPSILGQNLPLNFTNHLQLFQSLNKNFMTKV